MHLDEIETGDEIPDYARPVFRCGRVEDFISKVVSASQVGWDPGTEEDWV